MKMRVKAMIYMHIIPQWDVTLMECKSYSRGVLGVVQRVKEFLHLFGFVK